MATILDLVHELAGAAVKDILRPGCTPEKIRSIELELGWSIPGELKDIYALADGENMAWGGDDGVAGIFGGFCYMSLDTVAKEMNKLKSVAEYFAEGDAIDIRSMPQRTVQTEYYVDGWIPFACDGGGSYLAVDTVPDSDGTIAQVIIVA